MPMLRTRHFGTHYDLGIISCFMCTCLIEWKCAGWMSEYWVNASFCMEQNLCLEIYRITEELPEV